MAEALLKVKLKELGKSDINVVSAGVSTVPGMAPTENTVLVMREVGIEVSGNISFVMTNELVERSDLVLVMEQFHKKEILRRIPKEESKVRLLKEYILGIEDKDDPTLNILDPIGRTLEFYRQTRELINRCIEEVVKKL